MSFHAVLAPASPVVHQPTKVPVYEKYPASSPQPNSSANRPEGFVRSGFGLYIRYPNVGSEDVSDNLKPGQMPTPSFSALKVEGDNAAVTAITKDYGRVRFYLIKTDKGWRIDNAMYDLIWPISVHEKCSTDFLREPTPLQLKDAPAICQ